MSFDGISLWSAEYGTPNSHGQALAIREQIKAQNIPVDSKTKQGFIAVARAIEEFLTQAKPYFGDDAVFDYYQDIVAQTENEDLPVFEINYAPNNLIIEFSAPIVKAAREHNLVVMHNNLESVFLPDGTVIFIDDKVDWQNFVSHTEQAWQQKLEDMKHRDTTSTDDSLPESQTQINKIINDIIKARFKQAGIKQKRKVGKTAYYFEYDRIQVVFVIWAEVQNHIKTPTGESIVDFDSTIFIYINDIYYHKLSYCNDSITLYENISIDRVSFYRDTEHAIDIDYEWSRGNTGMPVSSLNDLKHQIALSVDMFLHVLPHCQDIQSLYTLLRNYDKIPSDIDDEYKIKLIRPQNMLALNKLTRQKLIDSGETVTSFRGYFATPQLMLALARLSQQPDFKTLIPIYKEEYMSDKYFSYLNQIRKSNQREKRIYEWHKARNKKYDEKPKFSSEIVPDDKIKVWGKLFDEMVEHIESWNVEAILNEPPKRKTDFDGF